MKLRLLLAKIIGIFTRKKICEKYDIYYNAKNSMSMLNKWIPRNLEHGEAAFIRKKGNESMLASFKEMVVLDYLSGGSSLEDIAAKYNLRSSSSVHRWVLLYNANKELKNYDPNREVYMADGSTTLIMRATAKSVYIV